jgi:hypothetical protein
VIWPELTGGLRDCNVPSLKGARQRTIDRSILPSMRASSRRTRYAVAGWVFAAKIADAPVPNLSRALTRGFDLTRRGCAGRWGQKKSTR